MTKRITKYGLLIALAFIFSYVEYLIPISFSVPGIKLGLTNIVIVFALMTMDSKSAIIISLIRILLFSFTFGNISLMFYSLGGTIFSLSIMILVNKFNCFSLIGMSMIGGAFHNIGQILVASIILNSFNIIYYLPVLLIVGSMTGIFIGYIVSEVLKRLPKNI